jgi:AraC-like DNA-binding protein
VPEPPSTRLIAASPRLAACVRGYIVRDTRGAELAPPDRFNHFPASPLCAVSWFIEGSALLDGEPLPGPIVFRGPQSAPTITANPGPVHVFMLLLMPDAVQALAGTPVDRYLDRFCDARDVLAGAEWARVLHAVLGAEDTAARIALLEDFLAPRWRHAPRGSLAASPWRYADWTRALALQAALSAPGRSLRQLQRRLRGWAGQPLQRLEGLSRAERAFLDAVQQQARGRVDWADVAAGAGYADQAQLCRAVRRGSGESPARLLERMWRDECFWVYRLWA